MNRTDVFVLIDEIYAMAHMLRLLFGQVENTGIRVSPHAVARIGEMMCDNIVRIGALVTDNHQPP